MFTCCKKPLVKVEGTINIIENTNESIKDETEQNKQNEQIPETKAQIISNKENINLDSPSQKLNSMGRPTEILDLNNQEEDSDFPKFLTFKNLEVCDNNAEKENLKKKYSCSGNKLLLKGELFFNREIIIDKNGMSGGMRQKQDGQTLFGMINVKDYTGNYYNDFVLNFNKKNIEKHSRTGRVFDISYQKKTLDYRLYFIHSEMILYYQIEDSLYFENGREYLILLGRILLTIITNTQEGKVKIEIRTEIAEGKNERLIFEENDAPITIGRVKTKLIINNSSISKMHGIIDFSQEMQLFFYKDAGSTNGSVLLIREDDIIQIKGDMKFRLEDIPFKIMELP